MDSNGKLTGSEAVYGVLAWMTCQDRPIICSARYDASIGAEIADMFCEANGLEDPRDNWTDYLTHPKNLPVEDPQIEIAAKDQITDLSLYLMNEWNDHPAWATDETCPNGKSAVELAIAILKQCKAETASIHAVQACDKPAQKTAHVVINDPLGKP